MARSLLAQHLAAVPIDSTEAPYRWVAHFASFGAEIAVRAAWSAARIVLPIWEAAVPDLRAPHDRLDAVAAWLECPCGPHARRAWILAYANGDDEPGLKGLAGITVEGRSIWDGSATQAHLCTDAAASCLAEIGDPEKLGQCLRNTAVRAVHALRGFSADALPVEDAVALVVDAIIAALQPIADALPPAPSPAVTPTPSPSPPTTHGSPRVYASDRGPRVDGPTLFEPMIPALLEALEIAVRLPLQPIKRAGVFDEQPTVEYAWTIGAFEVSLARVRERLYYEAADHYWQAVVSEAKKRHIATFCFWDDGSLSAWTPNRPDLLERVLPVLRSPPR